jgi:hypothetical protein
MYSGPCKGGPMDGRRITHNLPMKVFGERLNAPPSHKHIVAGEDEPLVERATYTVTGHYHWDYSDHSWHWRGQ